MGMRSLLDLFTFTLVGFLLMAGVASAGDLTPPSSPESTMTTLEEIEARTPISAVDLPLTIAEPGSYYLTESITFSTLDTDGIIIDSNSVTIDLNGFTLFGPGIAAGASGNAIDVSTNEAVAIVNGVIRDWRGDGIQCSGATNNQYPIRIERIMAIENGGTGINAGNDAIIESCHAIENGGDGIDVGSHCLVRNCVSAKNGADGISSFRGTCTRVESNTCYDNGEDGIAFDSGGLIMGNSCVSNDSDGIDCRINVTITGNECRFNSGAGIHVWSSGGGVHGTCVIEDNHILANSTGIDDSSQSSTPNYLASNRASQNGTDYSIDVDSVVGTGALANITF